MEIRSVLSLENNIIVWFENAWFKNKHLHISQDLLMSFLIENKIAVGAADGTFWKNNKDAISSLITSNFLQNNLDILKKEDGFKYQGLVLVKSFIIGDLEAYISDNEFEYHDEFEFSGSCNTKFTNTIQTASLLH